MLTGLIATFAPYLLIAAAAAGMAYALLYPILTGDVRSEKRRKSLDLAISAMPSIEDPANRSRPSRRDQVAQSLKEIELRKEARGKVTLEIKIMQSGVKIDRKTFYVASLISGIGCGALSFAIFSNAWTIVPGLVVGGLGIPHWYLGIKKSSRIKRFLIELPNALDVITRGLRSGLPLNDCIRMIAAESAEPVRSEFQLVMDAQGVGIPLGDAIEEIYDRIPVAEANYLAIIILSLIHI